MSWLRSNLHTVAYLILGVAVTVALWQTNQTANDRVREQERLTDQICESNAETRQAIIDWVVVQTKDQEVPADASPDRRAVIEDSNRRRAEIRAVTNDRLDPPLCADGVRPPSKLPPG